MKKLLFFILLPILSLSLTGCNTSPKQNNQPLTQNKEKTQIQNEDNSKNTEFDLSSKCSSDAENYLNNTWKTGEAYNTFKKNTISLKYQNHYNSKLNKCFIFIEFSYYADKDKGFTLKMNEVSLYDVEENKEYGRLEDELYDSGVDLLLKCKVLEKDCNYINNDGSAKMTPHMNDKAIADFYSQAKPYMED